MANVSVLHMRKMLRFPIFILFVLLSAELSYVLGETGCPEEETTEQCQCIKKPVPRLICKDVRTVDDIFRIFEASKRYTYQEVHIVDSAFPYFPAVVLRDTTVKELYFRNITVMNLIDKFENWQYEHPYKISIDNVKIGRGFLASNFTSFLNLTELTVNSTYIRFLSSGFSQGLPKSIKRLELYGTRINKIKPGALSGLPNLDKFVVKSGNVKALNRDIFSRPFNGRILNFDNNNISSIPDDMFMDMPNLQYLSMRNNMITTIPEAAFSGRKFNVPIFLFGGNPLQCDCNMLWIVHDKPMMLEAYCANALGKFAGRDLQKIKPSEFEC